MDALMPDEVVRQRRILTTHEHAEEVYCCEAFERQPSVSDNKHLHRGKKKGCWSLFVPEPVAIAVVGFVLWTVEVIIAAFVPTLHKHKLLLLHCFLLGSHAFHDSWQKDEHQDDDDEKETTFFHFFLLYLSVVEAVMISGCKGKEKNYMFQTFFDDYYSFFIR
jgi:hypothetical protein